MAAAPPQPPPLTAGLRFKLSMMMFLQFFIWGAWFELGFDYIPKLGFNGDWQLPLIFGAFNVGALVALFFSTQFADRKFAAEKFLAVSHLVGGMAILGLYFIRKEPGAASAPFWPFFGLMLLHSVFYVPTISITNSIAFANLRDPAQQFGPVRLWGTIGWIAASWPFIFILVDWAKVPAFGTVGFGDWLGKALGTSLQGEPAMDLKANIFLVAGCASLLLAAFSLALPHTPPRPATGDDSLAWLKAMKLLKHPFVMVLFLVTFIDAAVHQSFFFWTFTFLGPRADGGVVDIPANWVGPVMKIGQIAEIVTMLFLGAVLKRLGWRATMTLGILGHAARFAVFAYLPEQVPAILINILHGVCYAFFFATVYIFVDEYFPKDVRSSAQGLFNVLILGVGPFVANFVCGRLKEAYTVDGVLNYPAVFQYSMGAALLGAVILFVLFHPKMPVKDPPYKTSTLIPFAADAFGMAAVRPDIPGYVLGRELGRGGKAVVYEAADAEFGTPVAVKVLTTADPKAVRLFRRELRAGIAVRHTNLVRVRGGNAFAPPCYLVMDYLPGESLRDRLRRDGPLDAAEAVAVARQVAAGLAALHAAGFVHADVKPENVRLVGPGKVKLVDLGFAHRPGEDAELHAAGAVLGTANYLAPELCTRPPADGFPPDVFSLGVVLFEALTGELPYPTGSMAAVVRSHRDDPPADLRSFGHFSPGVARVVAGMMSTGDARPIARVAAAELSALQLGLLRRAG